MKHDLNDLPEDLREYVLKIRRENASIRYRYRELQAAVDTLYRLKLEIGQREPEPRSTPQDRSAEPATTTAERKVTPNHLARQRRRTRKDRT